MKCVPLKVDKILHSAILLVTFIAVNRRLHCICHRETGCRASALTPGKKLAVHALCVRYLDEAKQPAMSVCPLCRWCGSTLPYSGFTFRPRKALSNHRRIWQDVMQSIAVHHG